MAKYKYTNPEPALFTIGENDYRLFDGKVCDFPDKNAYVDGLVESGHLVAVKPDKAVIEEKK